MKTKLFTILSVLLIFSIADLRAIEAPKSLQLSFAYLIYGDDTDDPYAIHFNWKEVDNAESYKLYYRNVSTAEQTFKVLRSIKDTKFILSGIESKLLGIDVGGAAYTYYVTAVDAQGNESEKSNRVSSVCGRNYNNGDISVDMPSEYSRIVSEPLTQVLIDDDYYYDVDVVQDNSTEKLYNISFQLSVKPDGMEINEETGEITWQARSPGKFIVEVNSLLSDGVGNTQLYQIDVMTTASVFTNALNMVKINAYPNPANEYLNVDFTDLNVKELQIFDNRSNLRHTQDVKTNTLTIDVKQLESSSYYLVLIDNDSNRFVYPFTIVK